MSKGFSWGPPATEQRSTFLPTSASARPQMRDGLVLLRLVSRLNPAIRRGSRIERAGLPPRPPERVRFCPPPASLVPTCHVGN
ncbi:hypothetical protein SKAU_G00146440 [Synaphobranchus kaupii]|uniref:Uncharacterized protein n=1 Tax=Synaphobranchus kaupii TaxID=118154 RepID=A0A9Q1FUC9_SYNKA|nr:hypothetical protein SKAU_G00146440 [Synaphobranchus kaupii]